jgi:hypothetical protein
LVIHFFDVQCRCAGADLIEAAPWVHSAIPDQARRGGLTLLVVRENAVTGATTEIVALDTKRIVPSRDLVSDRERNRGRAQRK